MDTGTRAASIQSCDVAAALLFRIATAVFHGVRVSNVEPEDKQLGYGVWLSLRRVAAECARGREVPPAGIISGELTTLLEGAHFYAAAKPYCVFRDGSGELRGRNFHLCDCDVSSLCCSAIALIFTPNSDALISSTVRGGGRGQSPEHCAGAVQAVPAKLKRFIYGVSDQL